MSQAVLLGGAFIGILSALPIVNIANCCCLWIMGGGALAAYLEQQRTRRTVLPGRGAMLGLLAGIVGAVVWIFAFAIVDSVVGPIEQRMVQAMLERSVDMPPDVRTLMEQVAQRGSSVLRYVAGFAFQLVAGMVFSTLGGLLGAVFFRRDVPPALGGDPLVPPPIPE